jgi:hypothetical protein
MKIGLFLINKKNNPNYTMHRLIQNSFSASQLIQCLDLQKYVLLILCDKPDITCRNMNIYQYHTI